MYIVHAEPGKAICLGREGENLARQVVFDVAEWQELYGEGVVQLIAQRMGDTDPYPCVIEMDGNHAVWTITNADTAMPGNYGKCELSYYVGETLVKSETWPTIVLDAMCEPSADTPEPYQAYIDKMLLVGARAEAERIKAEQAAGQAGQSAQSAADSAGAAARSEQESKELAQNISKAVTAGVQIIQNEGSAQIKAIQNEGNTQVERVTTEGTAQVNAAKGHADKAGEHATASALSEKNAKASEESAAASAKKAEETVNNAAWIAAEVNEDGHLIVTQSDNFNGASFALTENGNLEVSYT